MTRPRCPKCQKYYVTQTFEQRPLPSRTANAIKRSLRRELPPIAPYRRYVCDICGHRWAVLVAAAAALAPPLAAASEPAWRGRTISAGVPFPEPVPSRSGATYPGGRSGTLMDAHPGASQRLRRREPAGSAPAANRPLAYSAASSARMSMARMPAAAGLAEELDPERMETPDDARISRWQELWRFILPS